jgi:hypothetical protein
MPQVKRLPCLRFQKMLSAKANQAPSRTQPSMTSRYLPPGREMPHLHLARLVVAFLTRKAKTTTLDLLARVSVLEGVAGVKPGTLTVAQPAAGLVEAPAPRYRRTA